MPSFLEITTIGNQRFRIDEDLPSTGKIRWNRATDDSNKTCYICYIPESPSLDSSEAIAAIPLALRITSPYVQKLIAADCRAGFFRAAVSEPPNLPTLQKEITTRTQSEERVRSLLIQLTKGIAARAAFPFGHGCLSPENVYIDSRDQVCMVHPWIVWLKDTLRRDFTTGTSNWEYTWLAPECIQQHPVTDLISDCYTACAIAFALYTGDTHVDANSALTMDVDISLAKTPNIRNFRPDCSAAFAAILQRGLNPQRGQRPQSPGELLNALEQMELPTPRSTKALSDQASFTADLSYLEEEPLSLQSDSQRRRAQSTTGVERTLRGRAARQRQPSPSPKPIIGIVIGALGTLIFVVAAVVAMTTQNSPPQSPAIAAQKTTTSAPEPQTIALPAKAPTEPAFESPRPVTPGYLRDLPRTPAPDSPQLQNSVSETPQVTTEQNTSTSNNSDSITPQTTVEEPATTEVTTEAATVHDPTSIAVDITQPGDSATPAQANEQSTSSIPPWLDDSTNWSTGKERARELLMDLQNGRTISTRDALKLEGPWVTLFNQIATHRAALRLSIIEQASALEGRNHKLVEDRDEFIINNIGNKNVKVQSQDGDIHLKIPWGRIPLTAYVKLIKTVEDQLNPSSKETLAFCEEIITGENYPEPQLTAVWIALGAEPPSPSSDQADDRSASLASPIQRNLPNGKEIVLQPKHGTAAKDNTTWRLEKHPSTFDGLAWQSKHQPYTGWKDHQKVRTELPNLEAITYTFFAEVGTPYHYWVRARTTIAEDLGVRRSACDAIFICFEDPIAWGSKRHLSDTAEIWPGLVRISGWGYGLEKHHWGWASARANPAVWRRQRDTHQTTVTFLEPGPHTLTIYLDEGPLAIDAIWLSQSQETRPLSSFNPALDAPPTPPHAAE